MDERAVQGVPWTMITFGAMKVFGVLTTIVLSRLLTPGDFGLFALATLGIGLLSVFNGNWLGATLIVRADMDERAAGTVLTMLLVSGVILGGLLALLAPLAASAFNQPRLEGILMVVAVILVFSGMNWFYGVILMKEFEFRRRFLVQLARSIAFSGVALTLGIMGAGVWSLVLGYLAGHVANGVALFVVAPYRVKPALDRSRVMDIMRGSRGFLGQELAEFFEQNADYISIGQVLGSAQLGYYSMGFRQAELPYLAIADPVGTVTFPAFARMRHEGKDVKKPFLTALRMVCLLTCPLGIIMSAAAHPFTLAIFGPKWLPMTGVLTVMGIWSIMRPLQTTFGRLLNSLGAAWLYGRISVFGLLPFTVGTVVAAKTSGIEAVAGVLLAYILVTGVLLMRVVDRRIGISFGSQWAALRPMLFASAVSWVATRATADGLSSVQPIICLIASSVACLLVYVAVLSLSDRDVLRTATRHARRAMPRRRAPVVAATS